MSITAADCRQLTGKKVNSYVICLQRISLLLSLMRAIIQRVTAASVSGLYFVTISLLF